MKAIKICGFTREEDVRLALELEVDLIGFVFAPSRREIGWPWSWRMTRRGQDFAPAGRPERSLASNCIGTPSSALAPSALRDRPSVRPVPGPKMATLPSRSTFAFSSASTCSSTRNRFGNSQQR